MTSLLARLSHYKTNTHLLILILFFLCTAGIYLHNITTDVYSGDIGDLVTASIVHGVAHPSGYPLFVFLGFLFSHLPLPLQPVTKVALISTIASLAGLIFLYKLCLRITKDFFLSLLSTAILGFSYYYWLHAEIPEVFGLNNFFITASMYFAISFYLDKKIQQLYLLALVCGLGAAHHQTFVLLFPGILVLLFKHAKLLLQQKKQLGVAALCFLCGFLPYLYVPIAAATHPVVNWDDATNLSNLIHLILRKDYGTAPNVVDQVPLSIKLIVVRNFFTTLFSLYSYQIFAVGILGVWQLFRKDRWLLFSLLVAFLISGPLFMYYAAPIVTTTTAWGVPERFYILPSILFFLFVPFGFHWLLSTLTPRFSQPMYTYLLLAYFLIIPLSMLKYTSPKTDLSHTHVGNTYASDILNSLPKHTVLFVSGDTTTFNIWYDHYVLHLRPDIQIFNPPGVGGTDSALDDLLTAYHKTHPKAPINQVFNNMLSELVQKRPVYATYEITAIPNDTMLLPNGLTYQIIKKNKLPDKTAWLTRFEQQWKTMHLVRRDTLSPDNQNLLTPEMPLLYSNGLIREGDFLMSQFKDPDTAEHYYRRSLWIDSENPAGYSGLAISQFKGYHDCENAVQSMKEAIDIYPIWKTYYGQLFIIYHECHTPNQTIQNFAREYQDTFKESIETNDAVRSARAQKMI